MELGTPHEQNDPASSIVSGWLLWDKCPANGEVILEQLNK